MLQLKTDPVLCRNTLYFAMATCILQKYNRIGQFVTYVLLWYKYLCLPKSQVLKPNCHDTASGGVLGWSLD